MCAQGICLEEMFGVDVFEGALYCGETRSREIVRLEENLRNEVYSVSREMHTLFQRRHTPKAKETKACRSCSLREQCQPKAISMGSARAYVKTRLREVNT